MTKTLVFATACLALATPALAQSPTQPLRYRYTTEGMGNASGRGGVGVAFTTNILSRRRYQSVVTLAARDSGGLTVWDITVDSARASDVIVDSVAYARMGKQSPDRVASGVPRPTVVNQVHYRDGQPIASKVVGAHDSLTAHYQGNAPYLQLLNRLPGLSLLLPNTSLPTRLGEIRTDTLIFHSIAPEHRQVPTTSSAGLTGRNILVPASERFDTTIVTWRRSATDTVIASSNQHAWTVMDRNVSTDITTTSFTLVFGSENILRAASAEVTRTRRFNGAPAVVLIGISTDIKSYSLVRLP